MVIRKVLVVVATVAVAGILMDSAAFAQAAPPAQPVPKAQAPAAKAPVPQPPAGPEPAKSDCPCMQPQPGLGPMGQGQGMGRGMGPMGQGPGMGRGMGPMGQGPGVGRGMGPGQGMRPGQPAGPGQGMGPMAQRRGQGLGPMGRGQTVGRQQMMARRAPRAAAGIAGAMRRLNLTQTQKDQLKLGRDQVQKDLTASRDKLQTARQKLRDAMTAPVPDEAAVKAAGLAMATIQADRLALQARTRAQLMKVLTPEQQQQLRQFQQRMNRR